jgi:hypothetical protein
MKAWEMASANSTWYVGTNKSTQGPKDPLPFDIKVKAMEAVYPEIKGHIVAETSWLTLASKVYEKHGNIVLNVYTDEAWVTKALVQYNGKEGAHGYYEFGAIQQQDTPRLSSATALRNAVAADDRDLFGQAAGVDPNTLVAGHPFFDVVKHYLMPHAEKAAAKPVKKKVKEPVAENNNISTMPTTEYVKGIYAAAAENGMGAPEVNAVKKQMVLAPNGEVDIIATMQKAVQVFQSPAWKKMIADLTALVKRAEAQQAMSSGINELSSELLGRYKKAAGADARRADAEGDYDRGNKRFSGIVKATKKQFANDEQGVAEGVAETIPWKEAQTVLNHYGADYFGTSYDKLYFYKYRKQFSIGLIRDEDGNGNHSVNLSELNAMVRKLRSMRVPLSPFEEGVAENYWDRLQREKALESAGVGIITKQNSTVDVNKNTPKKNLKAFKLI